MKKLIYPIFAITLAFTSCNSEEEQATTLVVSQEAPKTIKVKVAKVSPTTQALPINTSGVLSSKSEAKLSFKIGGIIEDILVEEGQYVRQGQVLAKLAQAEIQAKVTQANSALQKAQRDLDRAQRLFNDSVATLEQLQNAQTGVEVAKANLSIAEFNQQYSVIKAPSSGKVLRRFAEIRELAGPGAPILMIASTDNAQVMRVGLADRDVVKLKIGDQAAISFDAYPQEDFRAKVSEIAEAADPRTGTFEVELQVLPKQKPLKTGFVGKAQVFPSNASPYVPIPMGALVETTQEKVFIYLPTPDGKKAQRKAVRPIYLGADFFTVSAKEMEGISEVITDGNLYLEEGSSIEVEGKVNGEAVASSLLP